MPLDRLDVVSGRFPLEPEPDRPVEERHVGKRTDGQADRTSDLLDRDAIPGGDIPWRSQVDVARCLDLASLGRVHGAKARAL